MTDPSSISGRDGNAYSDWAKHYTSFEFHQLIFELTTLPEPASMNRLLGIFTRLIELAGNDDSLSDHQRTQVIDLAIVMKNTIRNGLANQSLEAISHFEEALTMQLDEIRTYGLYPTAATMLMI
jgi:hypothetical protein